MQSSRVIRYGVTIGSVDLKENWKLHQNNNSRGKITTTAYCILFLYKFILMVVLLEEIRHSSIMTK